MAHDLLRMTMTHGVLLESSWHARFHGSAQWEESFFPKTSVAIVILFWLKWAGYLGRLKSFALRLAISIDWTYLGRCLCRIRKEAKRIAYNT